LLAYLSITRAHILGSSAGGPIALQFGLDYPEMTDSLLLINTMTYSQEAQREVRRQELQRLKDRIASEGRNAAVSRAISERFPQMQADEPERFARIAQENLNRIDGIAATQQGYLDIGDSLESRLSEIKMPTLVVHGDMDSRIPVECGISLAAGITHSDLYIFPGAEHGLTTNAAAGDTQRIVLDFLGRAEIERERAA
jgi:3-oxoadipate enol-lactonase